MQEWATWKKSWIVRTNIKLVILMKVFIMLHVLQKQQNLSLWESRKWVFKNFATSFFWGEKVLLFFLHWILFSNSYTFPSTWNFFALKLFFWFFFFFLFLPCFGMLGVSLTSPGVLKKVWSNLSMATNFISNWTHLFDFSF